MKTETMLLAACLALGIDLASDAAELNHFLRAHSHLVADLGRRRPTLWDQLRTRTKARRQAMPAPLELT